MGRMPSLGFCGLRREGRRGARGRAAPTPQIARADRHSSTVGLPARGSCDRPSRPCLLGEAGGQWRTRVEDAAPYGGASAAAFHRTSRFTLRSSRMRRRGSVDEVRLSEPVRMSTLAMNKTSLGGVDGERCGEPEPSRPESGGPAPVSRCCSSRGQSSRSRALRCTTRPGRATLQAEAARSHRLDCDR